MRVAIDGLRLSLGGTAILRDVSLTLDEGQLLALLGPSGCGKTTTLRAVAGLETPDAGRILFGGEDQTARPPHERGCGMVFQNYALFPHLDVFRNVAFGLDAARWREGGLGGRWQALTGGLRGRRRRPEDERAQVARALETVRLDGFEDRAVATLSGGQRQRVALARALVVQPRVLLLDEPLANLDARLRRTMRSEIRALQQSLGITTLYVTHDQEEAMAVADRIAVMSEGRVEQEGGRRELLDRPRSGFVARFVGEAVIVPATVETVGDGETRVTLEDGSTVAAAPAGGAVAGTPVGLALRPGDVEIASGGDGLPVRVVSAEDLGLRFRFRVALRGGQEVVAETGGDAAPDVAAGSDAVMRVRPGRAPLVEPP